MGKTLGLVIALAGALSTSGCLSTHKGVPVHGTPPDLLGQHSVPTLNAPIPDHWMRAFVGPLPRPHLMGYVRTERKEGITQPLYVHWVYDVNMNLVGIVSDTGYVTRIDRFGKQHGLGQLPSELGILALFDVDVDDKDNLAAATKGKAGAAESRESASVVLTPEEAVEHSRALMRFQPMPELKD